MPSYIVTQTLGRIGETTDAILSDPGVTGFPDRRTNVPVRIKLVSEGLRRRRASPGRLERGRKRHHNLSGGRQQQSRPQSRTPRGAGTGFGTIAAADINADAACGRKRRTRDALKTPAAPARVVIPPRPRWYARNVPLLVRRGWYARERQPSKV